jgi:hypothetical protein
MRASRTYGSVRGASSNGRPYRDCLHSSTKWMLAPTVGGSTLAVKGSHGRCDRQAMDRSAGAGPGERDEVAGHCRTGRG